MTKNAHLKIILGLMLISVLTIVSSTENKSPAPMPAPSSATLPKPADVDCECPTDSICQVIEADSNVSKAFNLNIKLDKSTKIVVQQSVCTSCGYTLDFFDDQFKDTGVLKYTNVVQAKPKETDKLVVGGNDTMCFSFDVIGKGTAVLGFNNFRPWEKEDGVITVVQVNISDKGGKTELTEDKTATFKIDIYKEKSDDSKDDSDNKDKDKDKDDVNDAMEKTSKAYYMRIITRMLIVVAFLIFY